MIKSETLFEILDFLKSNEKNKKLNYYRFFFFTLIEDGGNPPLCL